MLPFLWNRGLSHKIWAQIHASLNLKSENLAHLRVTYRGNKINYSTLP